MKPDEYDEFAASYEAENATSLLNAHYERPAILALAGDVTGRRILDAGCGSGPLMAELLKRGATVTGIDASPAMIELARDRLGHTSSLHVGDIGKPLPFPDDSFDDVIASLVLHYLEDWEPTLAEFRRVLRPGGRLLSSVNHPTVRLITHPEEDYFATHQYEEEFDFNGDSRVLTMWHRPLHAISRSFLDAGFTIKALAEPEPSADTPGELLPPRIVRGERSAFLCFLFLVLEA